jgi:hypothetical protein
LASVALGAFACTPNDLGKIPASLLRDDEDAPVPTYEQLTHAGERDHAARSAHIQRILDRADEPAARARFLGFRREVRRGFALLIDQIDAEGWLRALGPLATEPWQDGMVVRPAHSGEAEIRAAMAGMRAVYTQNDIRLGVAAYFTRWHHRDWSTGWMRNDVAHACLHVGIVRATGDIELHLEVFNPLYTNGARLIDTFPMVPIFGRINWPLMLAHTRWENAAFAPLIRRSVNHYWLMRARRRLSF